MDSEKLATELLHEMKQSNKRWFLAFIIVLSLWFATIGAFIWYVSLPTEEYEITQENEGDSNTLIGVGDYGTTNSEGQEAQ